MRLSPIVSAPACEAPPRALVTEPTGPWVARGESRLDEHRGHERLRAEGGGPIHQLVFANQVIAALVILRCQRYLVRREYYEKTHLAISPAWSPTAPPSGDQLLAAPPVHRK